MDTLRPALLGCGLIFCGVLSAQAQEGTRYNVALTSNYVFRGISQSDNHAALQGGIDYQHAGGLYAGAWGTTQDIPNTRAHVRADGYGGFNYQSPNGLGFDVGARAYTNAFVFPGQRRDFFWEVYGGLKFGPASFNLAHDFDNQDTYAEAGMTYDLGSGVMLDLHVGHSFIKAPDLGDDYTDFGIRVSRMFGDLEASLSVTDTTQEPSSDINDATLILSGKYRF
ncbi:MAG: hypothetical protein A2V58_08730 [Candidatus Muproteobacteria bacterium RBG_19FT_COMBO_61_10]|jgi:uncharacterized protein (TIGR02001 family)|uniref:Outer membrane protein beta-barrel domain-containing protein n=1 Tax=Candidatus Muproteobacteria bacterium RBG_19FT_COMBO_61_10 TaxID=1817761 RepID=A0A1F6UFZ0_9PROT|nr:MAG: hypothetical protein A2V58_08730 [Candidatus Muproteobacteria bacterium RBG_19FT_COMBO_61_10]